MTSPRLSVTALAAVFAGLLVACGGVNQPAAEEAERKERASPSGQESVEEAEERERMANARQSPGPEGLSIEELERRERLALEQRGKKGQEDSIEELERRERAMLEGRDDEATGPADRDERVQPVVAAPAPAGARSIIAAPADGIYLGQTTFNRGEIAQLEGIVGKRIALVADYSLVSGNERVGAPLRFDLGKANRYADQGYAILVSAYEPYPGHPGMTVERLLNGEFDRQLGDLAAQFRQFRGQMFFSTCREPNGVLQDFYGGFGPDGSQSLDWAVRTGRGFADFEPPAPPEGAPDLYAGLGSPDQVDGIERLGAAQRYYFDFFVRRQGLTNLTFETMGWATQGPQVQRRHRNAHEERLRSELTFSNLLASIGGYYDWVSINWYLTTEPENETGYPESEGPVRHVETMRARLREIADLAPGRPVLITELGIIAPYRAEKARLAFELIRSSDQVKGIVFWGAKVTGNPFDGAIRPDEESAQVLRSTLLKNEPNWASENIEIRN